MTMDFPKEEIYGITSQIRRSSLSTHLNITEGYSKYYAVKSKKDLIKFLSIAYGSAEETKKLLEFCQLLDLGDKEEITLILKQSTGLLKLLITLIKRIKGVER